MIKKTSSTGKTTKLPEKIGKKSSSTAKLPEMVKRSSSTNSKKVAAKQP